MPIPRYLPTETTPGWPIHVIASLTSPTHRLYASTRLWAVTRRSNLVRSLRVKPGWPTSPGSAGGAGAGFPLRPSGFCVAKNCGWVTSISLWHTFRSPVHISGLNRRLVPGESESDVGSNRGRRVAPVASPFTNAANSASHRRRFAKDSSVHPLFCAYVFNRTNVPNSRSSTLPSSCADTSPSPPLVPPVRLRRTEMTSTSFLTSTAVPARLASAQDQ
mmetsp:Transcript_11579/g.46637  ORF Transcript_11579/g.46637 Transcript_11579/m.46637 type:complete len:218 (-) Transcript_11579:441-1094(-)